MRRVGTSLIESLILRDPGAVTIEQGSWVHDLIRASHMAILTRCLAVGFGLMAGAALAARILGVLQ